VSKPVEHRCGLVALGGRTNVGKSTLLNRLVGQKVAIVSPRPQTTRRRILGIRTDRGAQYLFLDAPGLHHPRQELNRRMLDTARRTLAEAHVIVGMIEAGGRLDPADRAMLGELAAVGKPLIVAINKVDLLRRDYLLPLIDQLAKELPNVEIVPVSALRADNLEELLEVIRQRLPVGPPLMPEDEYTDQTERMLAEEVIREKIFLKMREEVPFSTAVTIESFSDVPEKNLKRIEALIVVERESHKGMLIGAGGQNLKQIGTAARLELEKMLGARVFVQTTVKVEPGWTADPRRLADYGL